MIFTWRVWWIGRTFVIGRTKICSDMQNFHFTHLEWRCGWVLTITLGRFSPRFANAAKLGAVLRGWPIFYELVFALRNKFTLFLMFNFLYNGWVEILYELRFRYRNHSGHRILILMDFFCWSYMKKFTQIKPFQTLNLWN